MSKRSDYYTRTLLALTVGYFAFTLVISGAFYFGGHS